MSAIRRKTSPNGAVARGAAVFYIVCMLVGSIMVLYSSSTSSWSLAGLIVSLLGYAAIGFVTSLQENIYGFARKHVAQLDERQLQLRRRVFEKSYIALWCVMLAIILWLAIKGEVTINLHATFAAINALSLASSLPALFTTFEKQG